MLAFEGLIPSHDEIVIDLLFDLACWHAYAKLRLHTDDTLHFFDLATVVLGQSVRRFQRTVCSYYDTSELPAECASRGSWEAALASKQPSASTSAEGKMPLTRKSKQLNLCTYKYHALADYPNTI